MIHVRLVVNVAPCGITVDGSSRCIGHGVGEENRVRICLDDDDYVCRLVASYQWQEYIGMVPTKFNGIGIVRTYQIEGKI
jgi:hypothetical protein